MPDKRPSTPRISSEAAWQAAVEGDRGAFRTLVTPHLRELIKAARHEVRYRVAVGDFDPDDPTAEELVDEVLLRGWRERHSRPPALGVKSWLLVLVFRVADAVARRKGRIRSREAISLEDDPVLPEFLPDESTGWDDVIDAGLKTPEQAAIAEDELFQELDPRSREVLLMHELRGVPLHEIALALGIAELQVRAILKGARRRLRAAAADMP